MPVRWWRSILLINSSPKNVRSINVALLWPLVQQYWGNHEFCNARLAFNSYCNRRNIAEWPSRQEILQIYEFKHKIVNSARNCRNDCTSTLNRTMIADFFWNKIDLKTTHLFRSTKCTQLSFFFSSFFIDICASQSKNLAKGS